MASRELKTDVKIALLRRSSSDISLIDSDNDGGDENYMKFKTHLQKHSKTVTLIGFNSLVSNIKAGHLVSEKDEVFYYNKDETWCETYLEGVKIKKTRRFFKKLLLKWKNIIG